MQKKTLALTTFVALAALAMPAFATGPQGHPMLIQLNEALAAQGSALRVEYAEYVTTTDGPEFGRTIFASNRGNKQLSSDFVPGDSRRAWGAGTGISYINDLLEGGTASGLTPAQTDAAIQSAMGTWQGQTCSDIPLVNFGSFNFDFGFVQFLFGFGGVNGIFADVTHGGWLPGAFFDFIAPGGSNFILGVTFTLVFSGTDIDNNGKSDTGIREIYYNDAFPWNIGSTFDVETVALHEAGHGLSQAHFGDIFRDGAGGLHFAPRAVMNAAYSGVQQQLTGTDVGGHCSNWGEWPNN